MLCQIELLPYAVMPERQVYSRFCSLRHLSHARRLDSRLRLRAGPDYAAKCDLAWHRYCDGIKSAPCGPNLTHPPCSRLDIRLAAAVAGDAGGLLPHLFQPSPLRAGSCLLLQLSSPLARRPHLLFRAATVYVGVGKFLSAVKPSSGGTLAIKQMIL